MLSKNKAISYSKTKEHENGVWFEEGQVTPTFATPADNLDYIAELDLASGDEKITFSALEGLVNKTKPRIYLPEARDELWADTKENNLTIGKRYETAERFSLVKKYESELDGVVVYSTEKSIHYRNLATTVAGIKNLLPVTAEVYEQMKKAGVSLEVKADLSGLEYDSVADIYNYLYDNYWTECSRKIFVSVCPQDHLGYVRDIAVAVKSAVVWLDTRNQDELVVWDKFFTNKVDGIEPLKAGKTMILGWHPEERSGIGAGTKFGIATVPSDFYKAGSVLAGVNHTIKMPAIPKKDDLKHKTYVAIYISDGDNIQYVQAAMRDRWDQVHGENTYRGEIPLSWTISPSLPDLGPGIMNYFYNTSGKYDCFVTGPSGMGYAMFRDYNEPILLEDGTYEPIVYTEDLDLTDKYTKLTERYLTKCGIRVATIWDDITFAQTEVYEKNCHSLYGTTAHAFKPELIDIESKTVNNFRLQRLEMGYTGNVDDVMEIIKETAKNGETNFLSFQLDVWNAGGIPNIIKKCEETEQSDSSIEFVRGDHFFNLFNEANGMSSNLGLNKSTKVTVNGDSKGGEELSNGILNEVVEVEGNATVQFEFATDKTVTRYIVRNAGLADMDSKYNTVSLVVETSTDGSNWTEIDSFDNNTDDCLDVDVTNATPAKFARVRILNPGCDNVTRLTQVEFFGK